MHATGAVRVAQVVPQNVEKTPLYHWWPGTRLLVLGSRDGAAFDGAARGGISYQRSIDAELLRLAHARACTDALCAAWDNSLEEDAGLELLLVLGAPVVVCCSGHGSADRLEQLLPAVSAWCLLVGPEPGPLAECILRHGRHVEVLLGVDGSSPLPALPWGYARAVHLTALRANALQQDHERLRAQLPATVPLYDERHPHSHCPSCGADWVWRQGGRSRLDQLDPDTGRCRGCQAPAQGFTLHRPMRAAALGTG
ncbi:MAG: hypothetical protein ACOCXJ_07630, partial [Planctomycetota bacterium]